MSAIGRDELNRTAKILLDGDQASDINDAYRRLGDLVLQIEVGPDIAADLAAQAALLTTLNTGHRAMLGGVAVASADNSELTLSWARGRTVADVIEEFDDTVVDGLDPSLPTLRIAMPSPCRHGRRGLQLDLTWNGWCGGAIESAGAEPCGPAMPLAGVMAGALGVSEVFQHMVGSPVAGRRTVGLSLWRPDLDWRSPEALGPALQYLPNGIWLLGLGHLGQANAWSLGCLPYKHPEELKIFLVDFDEIVEANWSTGLLTNRADIGRPKTRMVQQCLEVLGHRTHLVERRFDDHVIPHATEPKLALAGFDKPEPRRAMGQKFSRVVDAGLGAGSPGYLDMLIHSFPSQLTPESAFPDAEPVEHQLVTAYEAEISHRTDKGEQPGGARCGVVELAGATAAASFVGAIAGALSIADLLRILHNGQQYASINVDLRCPGSILTAFTEGVDKPINPGYTTVFTV